MEDMKELIYSELKTIKTNHPTDHITCFQLLLRLFQNIISNPSENKYRNFKKTNELIKTKILQIPEILDFLFIIGYTETSNEILTYESDSLDNLTISIEVINNLLSEKKGYKVTIYQYDLTNGLAKSMGPMLIGRSIEGVWHTGVCVYDNEYYYGGGICIGKPKCTPYGYPVKEIDFGYTNKSQSDLEKYLKEIDGKYNIGTYNILYNNCNHFTDAVAYFLTGKHLPDSILKQHEQLLNTPMGQMIRPYLEQMSQQNNQFLPNMFEGRGNNNNNNNF